MKGKILLFFLLSTCFSLFGTISEEAEKAYLQGETAKNYAERREAFNQALSLYSALPASSGRILYNLGNCYYHLGEYGMAIWYYRRAAKYIPGEERLRVNLNAALRMAGISKSVSEITKERIFFFHYRWTEKQKDRFLSVSCVLAFLFLVGFGKRYRRVGQFFLAVSVLFGISLYLSSFPPRKRGVLLQAVSLRCDRGEHYSRIDDIPEFAGKRITVLEMIPENPWIKVKTEEGKTGYVLGEYIGFL